MSDLLSELYRRRWSVGAVALLAATTGYGLGARSPMESHSERRLLLTDTTEESVLGTTLQPVPIEERQAEVTARAGSELTRDRVIEALGLRRGDVKSVSATAEEGSSFITISVTTPAGVDAAAVVDQVGLEVVEQQSAAANERLDALAGQLREAATAMDGEIATVQAELETLVRDIAVLQLEVSGGAGAAAVEPAVDLALKSDQAAALRATRTELEDAQADFERRAREAAVAAAVKVGGLEVYGPAGDVTTSRALPPMQLGVLTASLAFLVMVGAAYFTAYRAETETVPLVLVTDPPVDRTTTPAGRRRTEDSGFHDQSLVRLRDQSYPARSELL